MVYQWGKIGVVTDEKCFAFQDALNEVILEKEKHRFDDSTAPCLYCWHYHMNEIQHDCYCGAHLKYFNDGDMICCVIKDGFTNIQECTAGFGITKKEAMADLLKNIKQ